MWALRRACKARVLRWSHLPDTPWVAHSRLQSPLRNPTNLQSLEHHSPIRLCPTADRPRLCLLALPVGAQRPPSTSTSTPLLHAACGGRLPRRPVSFGPASRSPPPLLLRPLLPIDRPGCAQDVQESAPPSVAIFNPHPPPPPAATPAACRRLPLLLAAVVVRAQLLADSGDAAHSELPWWQRRTSMDERGAAAGRLAGGARLSSAPALSTCKACGAADPPHRCAQCSSVAYW